MAQLVAFQNAELIHAVAAVDAVPPQRVAAPDADPVNRMAFYFATAEKSPVRPRTEALIERLKEMKQPATVRELGEQPRQLNPKEREELARWVDSLDRI